MVKNNHINADARLHLEEQLFGQSFGSAPASEESCRCIAALYCETEQATAVLSDLRSDRSRIYHGRFSETMGFDTTTQIDSIWEESIFARIHPDDLTARHLLELQLFGLLRRTPAEERPYYRTRSLLRMTDAAGRCRIVEHRTFYLASDSAGALWLALCLYGFAPTDKLPHFEGIIQNRATGEIIRSDARPAAEMLTPREKEVLQAVGKGLSSKEIARRGNISKHTVDRHRQNIREKLRVHSVIEALEVARKLGIFP